MWMDQTLLLTVLVAAASSASAEKSASYWAIYNATATPAEGSCLVAEGESVDMACCMGAGEAIPHSALQGEDTCFVLGEDLIPFSDCVGDGVYGYGENCVTDDAPFVAANAEECGCSFVIEGSGCYKANDIPGQQWFVYLDGDFCIAATDNPAEAPVAAPSTEAPKAASYWAIYNATAAPAEGSCLVAEGESVDMTCCMGAGEAIPHSALQGDDTCFVLGEDLIPFSGCVGAGVYGYGENCVTDDAPFVAANAQECGCSFVIEGSGCYKANDIPGQQWFVYLDGDFCTAATDNPAEAPVAAPSTETPKAASYWAIYNATTAPAESSCLVAEGESVDMACCMGAGETLPHSTLQGDDTCFVLGEDLIPFSGCVGDGIYGYGENCVTDAAPFVAANAEECGCGFVIEGSGCYKANDIPGQQWFVYLDGDFCATAEDPTGAPAATPSSVAPVDDPTGAPVAAPSTDAPTESCAYGQTLFSVVFLSLIAALVAF